VKQVNQTRRSDPPVLFEYSMSHGKKLV